MPRVEPGRGRPARGRGPPRRPGRRPHAVRRPRRCTSRSSAVLAAGAAYVPVDADDPEERADSSSARRTSSGVIGGGGVFVPRAAARGPGRRRRSRPVRRDRRGPSAPGTGRSRSLGPPRTRRRRLDHLHLGLDRHAEGRRRHATARPPRSSTPRRGCSSRREPLGPGDRVLAGLSVAFDASCEEMWLAWRHGACLVPAPRSLVRSGMDLGPWLIAHGITVVSTVPDARRRCGPPSRSRTSACSSSAARPARPSSPTGSPSTAARSGTPTAPPRPPSSPARALLDGRRPGAHRPAARRLGPRRRRRRRRPGRRGRGRRADHRRRRPRPLPRPGEGRREVRAACRSSAGSAPTAAATSCASSAAGLVFQGRADDQVKVGGRRIELGEIEAALQALPGVAGAAAAVQTTDAGNQVLVGYLALADGDGVRPRRGRSAALRERAARRRSSRCSRVVDDLPDPHLGQGRPRRAAVAAAAVDGGSRRRLELVGHRRAGSPSSGRPCSACRSTTATTTSSTSAAAPRRGAARRAHPRAATPSSRSPTSTTTRGSARWPTRSTPRGAERAAGAAAEPPCVPTPRRDAVGCRPCSASRSTSSSALRWLRLPARGEPSCSPRRRLRLRCPTVVLVVARRSGCSCSSPRSDAWRSPSSRARLLLRGVRPGDYPRGGSRAPAPLARRAGRRSWSARSASPARRGSRTTPARSGATIGARRRPAHAAAGDRACSRSAPGASIEPEVDLSGYWIDGDVLRIGAIRIGAERTVGARSTLLPGHAHRQAAPRSRRARPSSAGSPPAQRWAGSPAARVGKARSRLAGRAPAAQPPLARRPTAPSSVVLSLLPLVASRAGGAVVAAGASGAATRSRDARLARARCSCPLATLVAASSLAALVVVGSSGCSASASREGTYPVRSRDRLAGLGHRAAARPGPHAPLPALREPVHPGLAAAARREGRARRRGLDRAAAARDDDRSATARSSPTTRWSPPTSSAAAGCGSRAAEIGKRAFLGNSGMAAAGRTRARRTGSSPCCRPRRAKAKAGSSWLGQPAGAAAAHRGRRRRRAAPSARRRGCGSPARCGSCAASCPVVVTVRDRARRAARPRPGSSTLRARRRDRPAQRRRDAGRRRRRRRGHDRRQVGCSSAGSAPASIRSGRRSSGATRSSDTFVEMVAAPWFAQRRRRHPRARLVAAHARRHASARASGARRYWLPEADLVRSATASTVNRGCVVQTHLFHDRIMSMDTVDARRRARPSGPHSVILPGARDRRRRDGRARPRS